MSLKEANSFCAQSHTAGKGLVKEKFETDYKVFELCAYNIFFSPAKLLLQG